MSLVDATSADKTPPDPGIHPPKVIISGAPLLGRLTGIGRYTFQLARALIAQQILGDLRLWGDASFLGLDILSRHIYDDRERQGEKGGRARSLRINRSLRELASRSYHVSLVYQYVSGAVAERKLSSLSGSHIYHSPNFILPRFNGARIMTVHDLSVIRFPQFHKKQMVQLCEKGIYSAINENVHLITDSMLVKKELMSDFGVESERITKVHLAPDDRCRPREEPECREVMRALGLSYKSFFLSVGTLEPRKNLCRVFEAFRVSRRRGDFDWPLVVVGAAGWKSGKEHAMLDELVKDGLAIYLNYVTDAMLFTLYSSAGALVFPSLYEGFGLPAIEASTSGCPVLTSEGSAMAEFVPEGTELVNPQDVASISAGMTALSDNKDATLQISREAVRTWGEVASETCAAYRTALLG